MWSQWPWMLALLLSAFQYAGGNLPPALGPPGRFVLTTSTLERSVQHINPFYLSKNQICHVVHSTAWRYLCLCWWKSSMSHLCMPSSSDPASCPGRECWATGMVLTTFLLTLIRYTRTRTQYGWQAMHWAPFCRWRVLVHFPATQTQIITQKLY